MCSAATRPHGDTLLHEAATDTVQDIRVLLLHIIIITTVVPVIMYKNYFTAELLSIFMVIIGFMSARVAHQGVEGSNALTVFRYYLSWLWLLHAR